MKILHTVATLDPASGGPARSVPHLARTLAAAGHDVGLWAPAAVVQLSDASPDDAPGLAVFSGDFTAALDAFGTPDLVHDHGIWLPCHREVARVCAARGSPRIVSPRGMLEPWALRHKKWKKRIAWWLYQKSLLESTAALHATATSEADQLRRLGLKQPIILAPNGVGLRPPGAPTCPQRGEKTSNIEHRSEEGENTGWRDGLGTPTSSNKGHSTSNIEVQSKDERSGTQAPSPIPDLQSSIFDLPRTALFLSRIHPKKGLPMLLEAWARVRPLGWQLRIVGPDEGRHVVELKELCVKLELGRAGFTDPADLSPTARGEEGPACGGAAIRPQTWDRCVNRSLPVEFSPPLEGAEKWAAFDEADLFILPTYSENFGIAVAEALASGVPVITTKGAPWEGLHTHHCGWWTDISTAAIASALHEACTSDPATLQAMGARGRDWMHRDFSWDRIAHEMTAAYDWLLGGGVKPGCVRN